MKVGVFDSGVGGLSVANALKKALPDHQVVLKEDKTHVPYGTKQPGEILGFVKPIFQELVDEGCDLIVIACNTVSTTLLPELRNLFTVPLVAVEPMIEQAARLTKSGVIAVCATPVTLASQRYAQLLQTYAEGIAVLEPDCHDWAHMIEHKQIDEALIRARIEQTLDQNADIIVLGCTHYHWIEDQIKAIAEGRAQVLQPEPFIVQQVKQVLEQRVPRFE